MVMVHSEMLPLGTAAPRFSLPDPDGNLHAFGEGKSAYLAMFICNHCPFVRHVRDELARIGHEFMGRGVDIIAINSNDTAAYPADNADRMREEIELAGYPFPYVLDADQSVAREFRAACTPDFYLFDRNRRLVYRGQLDGSRPSNDVPVNGAALRAAIDSVLAGSEVPPDQHASVGCNIKWKPGNEPDYFG